MELLIVVVLIIVSIVLLGIILGFNFKKAKSLQEDKTLEKLINKFPDNITVAKEMLKSLNNEKVKVEETKSDNTSLYIAITDKILIANIKNNYSRIQTIAHECLHSIQDRKILLFNFIFSNISMVYWVLIAILTLTHTIKNIEIQFIILLLFAIIKLAIRGFLETDAIIKAEYLSREYMESKGILKKEELENVMKIYKEISKIAVPHTIIQIITSSFMGIIMYYIISLIK